MSLVLRSRERLVYGESGVGQEKEEEMCFELGSEREGDGERVEEEGYDAGEEGWCFERVEVDLGS